MKLCQHVLRMLARPPASSLKHQVHVTSELVPWVREVPVMPMLQSRAPASPALTVRLQGMIAGVVFMQAAMATSR